MTPVAPSTPPETMIPFEWPAATRRLWPTPADEPGRVKTVLFRRRFVVPADAQSVRLTIFAEGRFSAWLDGARVARGPWLSRPHRRLPVDLALAATPGEHVLAVAVMHPGGDIHNTVISHEPGLIASLEIRTPGETVRIVSDEGWRMQTRSGWRELTPRRGWALGPMEWIDAAQHPHGWELPEFDDADWPPATPLPLEGGVPCQWLNPNLPNLVFSTIPAPPPTVFAGSNEVFPLGDEAMAWRWGGDQLDKETWEPRPAGFVSAGADGGWEFVADNDRATLLAFDFAELFVGGLRVEVDCESPGCCEIVWSERERDGRPWTYLKGTTYADRWDLAPGRHGRMNISYSSFRFAALIFRGFRGRVRVRRFEAEHSELDSGLAALRRTFADPRHQAIWELCRRTLACGPQEGMTDCPSREQTMYVGDSVLMAHWLRELTGDNRLARYTFQEIFAGEQDGLVRDCLHHGGRRSFLDYNLLAVIQVARYLAPTGDLALAREVLPRAENIVRATDAMRGPGGLIERDWESINRSKDGPGESPTALQPRLFIDHPGMGWHNQEEPPIDRSGINTAVHALLVAATEALADICEQLGESDKARIYRERAAALAAILRERFWDAERSLYPDGITVEGARLDPASAQTNTLCLLAGLVPEDQRRSVATRAARDAFPGAWNGPYMHAYLIPILLDLGLRDEVLALIERRWMPMVEAGARAAWETFTGDHLDSWCHPWSAAPVVILPRLFPESA